MRLNERSHVVGEGGATLYRTGLVYWVVASSVRVAVVALAPFVPGNRKR